MKWLLMILLLCAPLPVLADPVTLIAYAAVYVGVSTYVVAGILIARQVYGAASARRKARAAAARARAEYNSSLTDRSVTVLQSVPPWRVVYGRAVTGGDIVAILTSDKTGIREDGSTYTKPDALKHLVVVCAAHEVAAIHEVYIEGVPVGTLDGGGSATTGEFHLVRTDTRGYHFTGSVTVSETIVNVLRAYSDNGEVGAYRHFNEETVTLTAPSTLTGPSGVAVTVVCEVQSDLSSVRVQKHLGTASQTADSYLMGLLPSQWTAADRLRGLAYCVVTLDLEDTRFGGGPPNITFDVSGRLLYDPRTGTTAWSANPALCLRDFLTAPWGYEVSAADVDDASIIVAANACDATISLTVGASTTTGPTYTCNGVFTTSDSREAVLEDLCECMAGYAIYGAQWRVLAGMWTPPVMALADDDLDGQIEIVQAGAGLDDLFNGLRGTYIASGKSTPADIDSYANAIFVAADGRELWTNITLPFTDNKARARNLARIFVERARSSLVIRYPAKLRAWPLQVGDRVTVTSGEYGFAAKTFRVTDWQFALQAPVTLTLQEDVPGSYDLADAASADPSPNTDLPSPWIVAAIGSLTAASGTAQLQGRADGAINARIYVSWAPVSDAYVTDGSGRIELLWSRSGSPEWRQITLPGDSTSGWIDDVVEGEFVTIEVRCVNGLQVRGPSAVLNHLVVGKSAAPANVAGLAAAVVPGGVQVAWTPSTELDYSETEVRYGASWAAGTPIFRGTAAGFIWASPAAGSYTLRARHIDTTGHQSAADATASVTLNATANVSGLAATLIPGGVQVTWAANIAIDYRETEVRYGASWAAGTPIFVGAAASFVWPWPAIGSYTLRARHRDIVGNESASDATAAVTVAATATVAGLAATQIPGGVQVTWTPNGDANYRETEVRYGASWAAGTTVFKGASASFVWPWPAIGSYTLRARHRDIVGNESASDATAAVTVAATATVAGLAATQIPGGVQVTWTPNGDANYRETEVRYGASWAAGTTVFKGASAGFVWAWPAFGSYTLRAKHRDIIGNESATDATVAVTVDAGSLVSTGQLGSNAATDSGASSPADGSMTSVSYSGPATVIWTDIATLNYTNSGSASVMVEIYASVIFSCSGGSGWQSGFRFRGTNDITDISATGVPPSSSANNQPYIHMASVTVAAGKTLNLNLSAGFQTAGSGLSGHVLSWINPHLKYNAIKR
jgi:hypothetical protein